MGVAVMGKRYYECLTCGRKFPHGQGVIIEKAGFILHFHSTRCAYKFLKLVIERADNGCIASSIKEVKDEFESLRREKKVEKVI